MRNRKRNRQKLFREMAEKLGEGEVYVRDVDLEKMKK